jgi:TonB-linked SusC/RagA family outer membrane protein
MHKEKAMKKAFTLLLLCAFILPASLMAQPQGAEIKGYVTDDAGNPLFGANVFPEGLLFGAASEADGFYSFTIPGNVVAGQQLNLICRFMGYKSATETITLTTGEHTINFTLQVDVLQLDAVVVTGMGLEIPKEKLGVTISKVQPGLVQEADQPNIVSALQGKSANVEIVKTSGDPGTNTFIRIRGSGSIDRTTQPLFVVDGTPIDNSTRHNDRGYNSGTEPSNRAGDLNMEDIESIEILKGAAASAIYGSRAANGVVLVTTKSGRPGKTRINFKSGWGMTEMTRAYPLQTWYGQGTKGEFRNNYARSWGRLLNVPDAPHYDSSLPEDAVYDHSREASDGGWIADNTLSISGGNNRTTFYTSFGYYYEKGHWIAGSDYQRFTTRVKASQVITSNIKITGNIAYAKTFQNMLQRGDNSQGMGIGMLRTPPEYNNIPYLDPNTGYHRAYRYNEALELRKTRSFNNPFWIMNEQTNTSDVNRVFGNVVLDADPVKFLNVTYTLGTDFSLDDRISVFQPGDCENSGQGEMYRNNFKYNELDGNLVATFQLNRLIENLRNVNASLLVGHNFNFRHYKNYEVNGYTMGVAGFNQLDNCIDIQPEEYSYKIATESYFGQTTIDLFDQLFLTGAMRYEGSSTFGAAKKYHWYPKFSAAWEFTKIDATSKIPFLSFGKLRFAWGEAGVQPGVYSTVSGFYTTTGKGVGLYSSTSYNATYFGKAGYLSQSSPSNDAIKPERTREWEAGTNLAFWNNRIGLEVTYYNALARDVLLDINLVPSTGYFDRTDNSAKIENKGWEITLDVNPIKMRNFSWNLSANWGTNRNEVLELPVGWEEVSRWGVAAAGHPLGEYRIQSWVRFGHGMTADVDGDGTVENIDEFYAGQWEKNDVYIPADGYPIMWTDRVFSGFSPNPDWTGSLRTEFKLFNNLTVSALFNVVKGYYVMNHGRGALYSYGTHEETNNRWHPDYETLGVDWGHGPVDHFFAHGEKGIGPGVDNGAANDVRYTETWYRGEASGFSGDGFLFIEDASYIKLREVAVSYTFRHPFIKSVGLDNIRVRLSGQNLVTWTDYTGYDPETNRRQSSGERGGDYFNQPQVRTYMMTFYFNM